MSYVVCVTFDIHADQINAFMPLMRAQARNSLDLEAGCQVFDICRSDANENTVFLYEVYADAAAFQDHLAAAHFKSFDTAVAAMVADKTVTIYQQEPL